MTKRTKKEVKVKKVKKVKTPKEIKPDNFLATFNTDGVNYQGRGDTAFDAFRAIEAPMKTMKGLATLQKGKQKAERFLGAVQVKRYLRGNKLNRLALAKSLLLLFK